MNDARGSSVDVVKELVTLCTATPMLGNAAPIWKAGQGLAEERVASATGAKTGILVPELKRLYVAVSPGEAKTGAAILHYDLVSAAQ